jgi:hypothetical protein
MMTFPKREPYVDFLSPCGLMQCRVTLAPDASSR